MKHIVIGIACVVFLSVIIFHLVSSQRGASFENETIGIAVEFNDHAAAAYIAKEKGWFQEAGIHIGFYKSYFTGMALAAALARGEITAAYMCLVPAINAYANAKVPLKVISGTHRLGYALVAKPGVVDDVSDLTKKEVRIGCVREGGAVDVLMRRMIENLNLPENEILPRVRRMNPQKLLLAIRSGQLEAAFLPEQWAATAEDEGFELVKNTEDIWPAMQGSVLVAKTAFIDSQSNAAQHLVHVTKRATRWINEHPDLAAEEMSRALSNRAMSVLPRRSSLLEKTRDIPVETMRRSMARLRYTTDLSKNSIQDIIDYMARLGYINKAFPAGEILEERFFR